MKNKKEKKEKWKAERKGRGGEGLAQEEEWGRGEREEGDMNHHANNLSSNGQLRKMDMCFAIAKNKLVQPVLTSSVHMDQKSLLRRKYLLSQHSLDTSVRSEARLHDLSAQTFSRILEHRRLARIGNVCFFSLGALSPCCKEAQREGRPWRMIGRLGHPSHIQFSVEDSHAFDPT